jgi:hypothetical protein
MRWVDRLLRRTEAPGIWTRLNVARGQLERTLDDYHHGVFLAAIRNLQQPSAHELELRAEALELAYVQYRAIAEEILAGKVPRQ